MLLEIIKFGSNLGMETIYKEDETPKPLKIIENISYADDNLKEHKLDIIYPATEKECYPFIVNIHGGAFAMYSKDKLYRNYAMRLAVNDFAVVNINYRLAPKNIYPSQIEDVLSALNFIADRAESFKLDKNNMFLSGDSAGAYLAAITACVLSNDRLKEKYNFKTELVCRAIAVNCGIYDFSTLMDKENSFPMKRKIVEMLFGRADYEMSANFPFSSVLNHVNESFPPAYIIDTTKKSFVKEAIRLQQVLRAKQVEHQLHIFEEEHNLIHAFNIMSKYPQSNIVLKETFAFFKEHLG